MDASSFQDLIQRVREGDPHAAAELVRRFEPQIRREIRVRLTDPGLRRIIDSVDICQSVLGNFFTRAVLGQFDLNDPGQLLNLLVVMAQNRLKDWVRQLHRQRRDVRRVRSIDAGMGMGQEPAAPDPTPSQVVAGRELLEKVRSRLTEEERQLADFRADGLDWAHIATEVGGTADTLRKRLARALDRVTAELDL